MTDSIEVGDTVRENWSGFSGEVKEIGAGGKVWTLYPTGRQLECHISCLVLVHKGPPTRDEPHRITRFDGTVLDAVGDPTWEDRPPPSRKTK